MVNGLETVYKEAAVAYPTYCPGTFLQGHQDSWCRRLDSNQGTNLQRNRDGWSDGYNACHFYTLVC
jgi:hypothetical protein